MQQIMMSLSPSSTFSVPYSTGYSTYSALLSILREASPEVSSSVHDTPLSTFRNSGLLGDFGHSNQKYHKSVRNDRAYRMAIGVTDENDQSVFRSLCDALMYDQEAIELSHGSLEVSRFESTQATHEELLEQAAEYVDPRLQVTFKTTACIEDGRDIQTRVPHRVPIFKSLRDKWNASSPEQYQLGITHEDIRHNVIAEPRMDTLQKHKEMISRAEKDDGETQPIFHHGFTCDWTAWFNDASASTQTALTALALFGEYSGVGSAVARGCGTMSVEVQD